MGKNSKHFYEFGEFRLDPAEKQLRRSAEVIPLTSKAFGVLLLFVRNGGHLLEKENFMREVW
jgi:DNA-binding winged helix-turn-helix (wHTH) protein